MRWAAGVSSVSSSCGLWTTATGWWRRRRDRAEDAEDAAATRQHAHERAPEQPAPPAQLQLHHEGEPEATARAPLPPSSSRVPLVIGVLQQISHPTAATATAATATAPAASAPSSATPSDIVYTRHVVSVAEDEGTVSIVIKLDRSYRELKRTITDRVRAALPWVRSVRVSMEAASSASVGTAAFPSPSSSTAPAASSHPGLARVKHVIAVSSCKGGVGKSTVAVNLAYALAQLHEEHERDRADSSGPPSAPLRIGLFDADVYGPSLPSLVNRGRWAGVGLHQDSDSSSSSSSPSLIRPLVYEGVKTMSYGYMRTKTAPPASPTPSPPATATATATAPPPPPPSAGALMRGAMVSNVVRELLTKTNWGDLDYLIVDMPPGTGDIHITLAQIVSFDAAVVVTTPHKLSYVDVVKGVDMMLRVNIPVVALVENLAYFVCNSCDAHHSPFGAAGHTDRVAQQFAIPHTFRLPIVPEIAEASERGDPFVLSTDEMQQESAQQQQPESAQQQQLQQRMMREANDVYRSIATAVHRKCNASSSVSTSAHATTTTAATAIPRLTFDAQQGVMVLAAPQQPQPAPPLFVHPYTLRLACRCAGCIDEATGRPLLQASRVPFDVRPLGLQVRGNYATAVHWSDGHASSVYPHAAVRECAHGSVHAARSAASEAFERHQRASAATSASASASASGAV